MAQPLSEDQRKKDWFDHCCSWVGYNHMRKKFLRFQKYAGSSHAHCEFCWARFSEDMADDLRKGYVTQDGYHWVCEECFRLFRSEFEFTIAEGAGI